MLRVVPLLVTLALVRCQPTRQESSPPSRTEPRALEDQPLETATIGAEEVQTLPEPKAPASASDDQRGRPCGWSSAWVRPEIPNPLLAGVGGTPMPTKIVGAEIMLPVNGIERSGELVAEIVIDPDGNVMEATIVKSFEPRWPEAEDAIIAATRQWKYEPPRLVRTPISLCTTIIVRP